MYDDDPNDYGDGADTAAGQAEDDQYENAGQALWPDVEQGEEVIVLCPGCGAGELCYDERVPRTMGMSAVRLPDGTLAAEPDPVKTDEASWETSETIGLICESCATTWAPEDGESIEELLARVGRVKVPGDIVECATCGADVDMTDQVSIMHDCMGEVG